MKSYLFCNLNINITYHLYLNMEMAIRKEDEKQFVVKRRKVLERICWHDGPQYKVVYDLYDYLQNAIETIEYSEFHKQYQLRK